MQHRKGQVVFLFGEGNLDAVDLGGKGAGLGEMVRLGVPVPPGFTVATTVARALDEHERFPARYERQLGRGLAILERQTGKRFGDSVNPLLVSVRSGARVSMPGMMDTVLNLGLNPKIVEGLAIRSGSKRFAWDSYRRFLTLFGDVVLDIPRKRFDSILKEVKARQGVTQDTELNLTSLRGICTRYRKLIRDLTGRPMPDSPKVQLNLAIQKVFGSWFSDRAKEYRRLHEIPEWWGTAVTVQSMVFGNYGPDSGTGVVFSRNISTGAPGLYGEFLVNAQGEDVVAGIRTPQPISKMREWNPTLYAELEKTVRMLENRHRDAVDVEFTVERGRLYILQVRAAKRSPISAMVMAIHFKWEGLVTREEAVARVAPAQVEAAGLPVFDPVALSKAMETRLFARGLPASPGAVVGRACATTEDALEIVRLGGKAILIREETSPDDLSGMLASVAIVTGAGGFTSHAALVARERGKPAVVGAKNLKITEGDIISVDGTTGLVVRGRVTLQKKVKQPPELRTYWRWVSEELKAQHLPRLGFEYIDESVSINQLLNDFYLSEAMAAAALGAPLQEVTELLRVQVHISAAERIVVYLALAVAGEARHYGADRVKKDSAFALLRKQFGVVKNTDQDRAVAHKWMIKQLRFMTLKQQQTFFYLAFKAFSEEGNWGSAFGGWKWARIAETGWMFLSGKLNHSVFVDHAFDLEHNGGSVFGKHHMLRGDKYSLKEQLDIKKKARNVMALKHRLGSFKNFGFSPRVEEVFNLGLTDNWDFRRQKVRKNRR